MCIVDIDGCAKSFRQQGHISQGCDVSVHTEDTVGHDESGVAGSPTGEQLFQMIHVPMVVDAKCGPAQAAAIDQACMAEAIGQDESVFSDQCRNGADIDQISGCEGECGFRAFKPGECCFEFLMGCQAAADET